MASPSLPGQHSGSGGGALPLVDVAGMVNRIGAAAMSRAHAYAREGRVENLAWHPEITELTAEVFGTAQEPYEVGVYLKPQQATFRYAGGWCTCPISADCKHVAAGVLAANTQRLPSWSRFDLGANYLTRIMDRDVTFRARIDNAFDRNYWASAGGYPGAGYLGFGAPRTVSVSASVDF